jgi:hypothetical protein
MVIIPVFKTIMNKQTFNINYRTLDPDALYWMRQAEKFEERKRLNVRERVKILIRDSKKNYQRSRLNF